MPNSRPWSVLLLALLITSAPAGCPRAQSDVHVVDADTIRMGGTTWRLHGIDGPELAQECNGWLAGAYAAAVLRNLVSGRYVLCIPITTDRYGRTVARCLADGEDLGAEMVRQGMAHAFVRYSDAYVAIEQQAKAQGLGIHGAGCVPAWEYRKARR